MGVYIGTSELRNAYIGEFLEPVYRGLCFTANTAGSTVKLSKNGSPTSITTMETKVNDGVWTTYTFGNTITLPSVGDKVYFRNASQTTTYFSTGSSNYYYFTMTGSIAGSGEITYLLNKNGTDTINVNGDYCFYDLFRNCTSLTSAPDLPATTLRNYCYGNMFYGCTSLSTIPSLPATTLSSHCYAYMFYNCSNIKLSTTQTGDYQTPYRLPSTGTGTTATSWSDNMFTNTGGTFKSTPTINTTYYTSNTVI